MRIAKKITAVVMLFFILSFYMLPLKAHEHEGEDIEHVTLYVDSLLPSQSSNYTVHFSGGPLFKGWLFLLGGRVNSSAGILKVELLLNGSAIGLWSWTPTEKPNIHTLILPESANYTLRFTNISPEGLNYSFYFDQSCECLAKDIPAEGGMVIFQVDLNKSQQADIELQGPENADFDIYVGYLNTSKGEWPHDFVIIGEDLGDESHKSLQFTAKKDGRYYIMVKAERGVGLVLPVISVTLPQANKSFSWFFLLAIGVIAIGAASSSLYVLKRKKRKVKR